MGAGPARSYKAPLVACELTPEASLMNQEFTNAVYQIVAAIPAGRVASYGQVARQAGYPRHARFVGRLMGRLPKGSTLPWHRVIRGDGGLPLAGTPSGKLQIQRLSDEGVTVLGSRVPKSCFWRP